MATDPRVYDLAKGFVTDTLNEIGPPFAVLDGNRRTAIGMAAARTANRPSTTTTDPTPSRPSATRRIRTTSRCEG